MKKRDLLTAMVMNFPKKVPRNLTDGKSRLRRSNCNDMYENRFSKPF